MMKDVVENVDLESCHMLFITISETLSKNVAGYESRTRFYTS